jgi:putative DNA primase/helicase
VVYVVEGEKCVDALVELGLTATTTSGGANNWSKADGETIRRAFAGRRVVVLPDNDEPGRRYAASAMRDLLQVAAEVKVLPLSGLPEHGDVVDWLADDHTVAELEVLADERSREITSDVALCTTMVIASSSNR